MAARKRREILEGSTPYDNHAIRELMLWQENTQPLERQEQSIRANLARKMLRKTYQPARAPKAWMYLADATSKSYAREFGGIPTSRTHGFSTDVRRAAAKFWAGNFEDEAQQGGKAFLEETAGVKASRNRDKAIKSRDAGKLDIQAYEFDPMYGEGWVTIHKNLSEPQARRLAVQEQQNWQQIRVVKSSRDLQRRTRSNISKARTRDPQRKRIVVELRKGQRVKLPKELGGQTVTVDAVSKDRYGQIFYFNTRDGYRWLHTDVLDLGVLTTRGTKRKPIRRDPQRVCPVGTEVQSLIFDKGSFGEQGAKKWAREHDFKASKLDETENSYRIRQRPTSEFRTESFRTITLRPDVKAVIGCPR